MARRDWEEAEKAFHARTRSGARWSRWGRGSCEGYGLEFGTLLRFSVVRNMGLPESWRADLNAKLLGVFGTFDDAIAHVEREARTEIEQVVADWEAFKEEKPAKRLSGATR